jgi:hypothetical protein
VEKSVTTSVNIQSNLIVEVSVVIPVYRKERNESELVRRLYALFEGISPRYEIVFVTAFSANTSADLR